MQKRYISDGMIDVLYSGISAESINNISGSIVSMIDIEKTVVEMMQKKQNR